MSSNYPAGATGSEYEIAGADSITEGECDCCGAPIEIETYRLSRWGTCDYCDHEFHEDIDSGDYYDFRD